MLVGAAAMGIAAPAFAQIPVPTVEAPVPVPTVQAPPLPPVPTVRLPVPTPTLPQVPVPTPSLPVPVPTAPPSGGGGGGGGVLPSIGSGGSGGSGGGSSGAASGTSGGSGGSSGGSTSSRGGSSAGSGSSGGSGGSSGGSARAPSAAAGPSSARPAPSGRASRAAGGSSSRSSGTPASGRRSSRGEPAREKRERKLRKTVRRTQTCLDELSAGQRRVLTLRAGVGAGPPRSRGHVAEALDVAVRRVVRLERTGLRRLRALDDDGRCAPALTSTTIAEGATAPTTGASAISGVTGGSSAGDAHAGGKGSGGAGGSGSRGSGSGDGGSGDGGSGGSGGVESPPDHGGVAGVTQTNRPGGSVDLTLPLLLLVLAGGLAVLARVLRRRPAAVTDAAPPEREPWIPWRRSTMTGPGWTEAPPPTREDSWAGAPHEPAEPEPQPEPWSPPRSRAARR